MFKESDGNRLWYSQPAKRWEEALPIGNGRIGAMTCGRIKEELLYLNEETIWYGGPRTRTNKDMKANLPRIRQHLFNNEPDKALYLARMAMTSGPKYLNPYQPLGELKIFFADHEGDLTNYRRELDLSSALSRVSYELNGVLYTREMYAAKEADVMVMKLTADKKGALTFSANLNRRPFEESVQAVSHNRVLMTGQSGSDGVKFAAVMQIQVIGGSVTTIGDFISVEKADEAVIYLAAGSTYRSENPPDNAGKKIDMAITRGYDVLKSQHIRDYKDQYDRVCLQLEKDNSKEEVPTDLRARDFDGTDLGLTELFFNYGRYLMISSSQPGSLPANLQGIWNASWTPAWESKYTININLEMNYWLAEVCGLSDCHEPLFDLIDTIAVNGRRVAKEAYGCRGFMAHHNTNIWGDADCEGILNASPYWQMGGAWLCLHLWEHYAFSQDLDFLRERALPLMKEAARFILDFMVEDEEGRLVTGPTLSPENHYRLPDGRSSVLCMGPSMDTQISRELFNKCLEARQLLNEEEDIYAEMESALKLMPEIAIGKHGQIMEWSEDYDEPEPGHRHISHLFALHPGSQISETKTPELFEAAKVTLKRRLENGGGHTSWSRAWIVLFYARLRSGNESYKHLVKLINKSTYPNLYSAHPPFQIDGNLGSAAGVAEMLLQSHDDCIELLPALPDVWPSGRITGLKARGGVTIDMVWKEGHVKSYKIQGKEGNRIYLKIDGVTQAETIGKDGLITG